MDQYIRYKAIGNMGSIDPILSMFDVTTYYLQKNTFSVFN